MPLETLVRASFGYAHLHSVVNICHHNVDNLKFNSSYYAAGLVTQPRIKGVSQSKGSETLIAKLYYMNQHASYLGLSRGKKHRRSKYINLFSEHLDGKDLTAIRNCAQIGTPLGDSKFIKQTENKLKLKVGYSKWGRSWN